MQKRRPRSASWSIASRPAWISTRICGATARTMGCRGRPCGGPRRMPAIRTTFSEEASPTCRTPRAGLRTPMLLLAGTVPMHPGQYRRNDRPGWVSTRVRSSRSGRRREGCRRCRPIAAWPEGLPRQVPQASPSRCPVCASSISAGCSPAPARDATSRRWAPR